MKLFNEQPNVETIFPHIIFLTQSTHRRALKRNAHKSVHFEVAPKKLMSNNMNTSQTVLPPLHVVFKFTVWSVGGYLFELFIKEKEKSM